MSKAINHLDIHGHLNFPDYDIDREACIARAREAGVGMVTVGTDIESSKKAVELAEKNPDMWATIGIHPNETDTKKMALDEDRADFEELRKLALHPRVVAIGECGLDYFHSDAADIPAQKEAFERHIALANEARKPLMLHVRNAKKRGDASSTGGDAYRDTLDILKKSAKVPFDFHFFAGSNEIMREICVAGGMISFTGVVTFTRDYDDLIRTVPLDRLMSETDCPYVSPVPHRGERNEPVNVIETIKAIARIRGEDESSVSKALLDNGNRFFGIF